MPPFPLSSATPSTSAPPLGQQMYQLITTLYPICRSITGDGVRQTLQILQQHVPLEIHEVPSGTQVYDWTVPQEWNIRDAYIKNARGEKIIDFQALNLHVVNYSTPIHQTMSLEALKQHLYSLPDHPDWVPYRTTYYQENWGFCLAHNQLLALEEGDYEVYIDATLAPGHLTYGEAHLPGHTTEEVLISCHVCHPSLANDNLSGMAIATFLAKYLATVPRHYSYRFLFIPGTIGSITWLCLNEAQALQIKHGLVLTCLGDAGKFTYKRSRRGNAEIDQVAEYVLQQAGIPHEVIDFFPYGYDERQYCSPGFNLAVGCMMRSPHGRFPEYHTSADNLDFVTAENLAESYRHTLEILQVLERNRTYLNQNSKCEPRLGKRGLYKAVGGHATGAVNEMALLWVLNLSDGDYSLLEIAKRSGLGFDQIYRAAQVLEQHDLLQVVR
ncbi:MAG TPA: DUF4910 domain-containing protein [Synechococcales cyanobacterium M55_K2018_004]|nr:DUF4910 domain-containing protein [Synechococcales cyanobacterium M55_K2018_004]